MNPEQNTYESREALRERKRAQRKKEQRLRRALIILGIVFSVLNIGFGIFNIYTLIHKDRGPQAVAEEPSETPDAAEAEVTKKEPSETEPVNDPEEPLTEGPETDPAGDETDGTESDSAAEPSGTDTAENEDPGTEISGLESDPRFEVTKKYEPIGVIHNVNNFLNIRMSPDPSSVIIGKAMRQSAVTVLEKEENGWLKIRSGEHEGYVSGEYVATGEEGEVLAMEYCKNNAFSVTADVPVYRSANTKEEVVFQINPENGYPVLDVIGGWVKIQITDGLSGYVSRDAVDVRYTMEEPIFFVADQDISELRLGIVNKAFEYYGGSYVWGGTDLSKGVDCSGFTLRIYESFGINLPRLSSEQAKWGKRVNSMAEALPGDLLFFHGYRNGTVTEGVGHVAIYIGNGKMIHAASEARGIVADNYNYLGEPIGIRRVITEDAESSYHGSN